VVQLSGDRDGCGSVEMEKGAARWRSIETGAARWRWRRVRLGGERVEEIEKGAAR
jgi:hypothetical protein